MFVTQEKRLFSDLLVQQRLAKLKILVNGKGKVIPVL